MAGISYVAAVMLAVALAVCVLVWRTRGTRAARRQFERLLAAAHHPSRRLVEVAQTLRRARTGHLLLVIDVCSGQEAKVWMSTPVVTPGELALLVWMEGRWVLMERIPARHLRRAALDRRHAFGESALTRRFSESNHRAGGRALPARMQQWLSWLARTVPLPGPRAERPSPRQATRR